MSDHEERKRHPVQPSQVKSGDLMALIYYVKVIDAKGGGEFLQVGDLDNNNSAFEVRGAKLVERALSADQFHEEVKVSKTQAAEILITSPNRPLTVCFTKQEGDERTMRRTPREARSAPGSEYGRGS